MLSNSPVSSLNQNSVIGSAMARIRQALFMLLPICALNCGDADIPHTKCDPEFDELSSTLCASTNVGMAEIALKGRILTLEGFGRSCQQTVAAFPKSQCYELAAGKYTATFDGKSHSFDLNPDDTLNLQAINPNK